MGAPAGAQDTCSDFASGIHIGFDPVAGTVPMDPANCACTNNCLQGFHCYPPMLDGAAYSVSPAGCNPKTTACTVRATVPVTFPGNSEGLLTPGSGAHLDWSNASSSIVGSCGYNPGSGIFGDRGNAWIQISGFTCSGGAPASGTYSLLAQVCMGCTGIMPMDRQATTTVDLSLPGLSAILCKKPPVHGCPEDGPAGTCCLGPGGAGGGGGSSPGGGPGFGGPGTGPDTFLYYLAGGVGNPAWPGTSLWTATLGRYWSHTYAERIVFDPDETHVWLITRYGTFREFSGLSGGAYGTAKPTDEHRKLTRTATGWRLAHLDGTLGTEQRPLLRGRREPPPARCLKQSAQIPAGLRRDIPSLQAEKTRIFLAEGQESPAQSLQGRWGTAFLLPTTSLSGVAS